MLRFVITTWAALALFWTPPAQAEDRNRCELKERWSSSYTAWIDAVTEQVFHRKTDEEVRLLRVQVEAGRGVNPDGAQSFERRLNYELSRRPRGVGPSAEASITLSIDRGDFWAIGSIQVEGRDRTGLAVSCPIDHELDRLLGLNRVEDSRSEWSVERLGALNAEISVLDVLLMDLNNDDLPEILLLTRKGPMSYRLSRRPKHRPEHNADSREELKLLDHFPLITAWRGEPPQWPRFPAGWLAAAESPGTVLIGTTGGKPLLWDVLNKSLTEVEGRGVPLRTLEEEYGESRSRLLLELDGEGASLRRSGRLAKHEEVPQLIRDAAPVPNKRDAWIFVSDEGELGVAGWPEAESALPAGTWGDRILVAPLQRQDLPHLVTSSSAGPDSPDALTIHRIVSGKGPRQLFHHPFRGSIVGLAHGDIDFDGTPDLLVVEQAPGSPAILWRVEHLR
ncbi:MAG: hypothetical protein VX498_06665 [Myxococcota bacterium]|nr:hypothetical protein [Myxococcota bacterium]